MSDLISRGKLLGTIEPMVGIWYDKNFWIDYKRVLEIIKDMPSAEIPERTAKVKLSDGWFCCWECGYCTEHYSDDWKYCPNCGAKLDWSGNNGKA